MLFPWYVLCSQNTAMFSENSGLFSASLSPTMQKAEQRLTAVPLPALLLLRVQREMQFSYWHSKVLNSLICLSFLEQHLRLVNNPGMGAIRAARQSKVIMNLLKCMRDIKCETERKEEKKKTSTRGTFHCSGGIGLNKLQISCHLKRYQTLTQVES